MSRFALPCLVCGSVLENVGGADNQPAEGTEFRTSGHYGSTFFDSFDGEELVLNVCDACLRARADRLAVQKRFLPVRSAGFVGLGRQYVDRPLRPYPDAGRDREELVLDPAELGTDLDGVVWAEDIAEQRDHLLGLQDKENA